MLATPPRPSNNSEPSASPTCVGEHPNNNNNNSQDDDIVKDSATSPTRRTLEYGETLSRTMTHPRSCILQVGACTGKLCALANTHLPLGETDDVSSQDDELVACMSELLQTLLDTATSLHLDLIRSIRNKMALNAKKYPVDLCKGKAGKYTQYSEQTGITRDNQFTEDDTSIPHSPISWEQMADALPELTQDIAEFAIARDWDRYHTPRNLVLAMLGEVGELAELVQWRGDDSDQFSSEELNKLSQELADVTIYLLRTATSCKVVERVCQGLKDLNSV